MYAYLASMQNRNAIMFARKNTEPLNLLNCLMNAQGKSLTPKQITKIKAEFESLFSQKTLDTVIKKFTNDGEYNMYAKEIGCAMAITYLVYKNSLAELNYNRYPKHNSRLQLDIEPIEIGMWGRNGRI